MTANEVPWQSQSNHVGVPGPRLCTSTGFGICFRLYKERMQLPSLTQATAICDPLGRHPALHRSFPSIAGSSCRMRFAFTLALPRTVMATSLEARAVVRKSVALSSISPSAIALKLSPMLGLPEAAEVGLNVGSSSSAIAPASCPARARSCPEAVPEAEAGRCSSSKRTKVFEFSQLEVCELQFEVTRPSSTLRVLLEARLGARLDTRPHTSALGVHAPFDATAAQGRRRNGLRGRRGGASLPRSLP